MSFVSISTVGLEVIKVAITKLNTNMLDFLINIEKFQMGVYFMVNY